MTTVFKVIVAIFVFALGYVVGEVLNERKK